MVFLFLRMPEVARVLSLTLRLACQVPSPRSYQKQPRLGAGSKCPNGLVTVSAIQMQTGADSSALQGWEEHTCPGTQREESRIIRTGAVALGRRSSLHDCTCMRATSMDL